MDLAYIQQNWKNEMNVDLSESIRAWDSVAEDYVYDRSVSFEKDDFLKYLQKKITFYCILQYQVIGVIFGLMLSQF